MKEQRAVIIDIERMQKALAQPSYTMPEGLNREQIRQFILDKAQKIQQGEKDESSFE
jgi:hypothetical protein